MQKQTRSAALIATAALGLALAGCQSVPLNQGQQYGGQQYGGQQYGTTPNYQAAPAANTLEYGYVSRIETLQNTHRGSTGAGIVLGAVVGGLLGNQVGGGDGRRAATIAGAVGGAMAGNAIEGRMNQGQQGGQVYGYRIHIQVDNGATRLYDVTTPGDLRVGDRVQVRNGEIARVR